MKYLMAVLMSFAVAFSVCAREKMTDAEKKAEEERKAREDRIEDLIDEKEIEIAGVDGDTVRDDDTREKIAVLEINTFQNEDEQTGFRIHILVELKDKEKNTYFIEYMATQTENLDSEYTGEDYWRLRIPYGDFKKLDFEAYAVHYGVMDDGEFLPLVENYDDVDSMDEIRERTTTPFPGKVTLRHSYMYEDSENGEDESSWKSRKNLVKKQESKTAEADAVKEAGEEAEEKAVEEAEKKAMEEGGEEDE